MSPAPRAARAALGRGDGRPFFERWVERGEAPAELTTRHPQTRAVQALHPSAVR